MILYKSGNFANFLQYFHNFYVYPFLGRNCFLSWFDLRHSRTSYKCGSFAIVKIYTRIIL